MRRVIFSALGAVACAALVVLSARGEAPLDQYKLFKESDPTIQDRQTFLEWERFPERTTDGGTLVDFTSATAHCASLGPGWRLATVKELLTIVDEDPHPVYRNGKEQLLWVDRNAFPTAVVGRYWSSSKTPDNDRYTVDFASGGIATAPPLSANEVRCVRSLWDAGAD